MGFFCCFESKAVLSINKGHSDTFMESLRSAVFRSWGVEANLLCWTWGSLHKGCARLPTALHLSSPSGHYILSFSCIFIAANLGSNLAQGFSGADYPCNIAISGTDICAGQWLVKMGCHTFCCSFSWTQPVLFFSVKTESLKKTNPKQN